MFSLSLPLDPLWRTVSLVGIGVFLFVWIFMFAWVIHDAMERSRSVLFHCLAGTVVLLFHVVGLCIYLLFRPRTTLHERYLAEAQYESLRAAHTQETCSQCGATLSDDYIYCPECGKKMKQACPKCGKPVKMTWKRCPHCGYRKKQPPSSEK